jgi:hypothetical protein
MERPLHSDRWHQVAALRPRWRMHARSDRQQVRLRPGPDDHIRCTPSCLGQHLSKAGCPAPLGEPSVEGSVNSVSKFGSPDKAVTDANRGLSGNELVFGKSSLCVTAGSSDGFCPQLSELCGFVWWVHRHGILRVAATGRINASP